jgi:serine/threonine-protein kinase
MAPEVILGKVDIDRRVDVYALRCVAYFLLTGDRVFCAENRMNMLIQHVQDEPLPPSRRANFKVPPEVDDLIMACLHRDPNERPASAEELLHMAKTCTTFEVWDQRAAKKWWEAHLPHLVTQATVMSETFHNESH